MNKLRQLAPSLNAFAFTFADDLLSDIRHSFETDVLPYLTAAENQRLLFGGQAIRQPIITPGQNYFNVSYGAYPLLWISGNNLQTHALYQRFYTQLGIDNEVKQLLDYDREIVVYCGFFVVGNRAPVPNWHFDYEPGANAYTLITPLYEPEPGHGNLLYMLADGRAEKHTYKLNEAVIFGDHFKHSTQPYPPANTLRVMLSLTFGTDKMSHWETLKKTIAGQSEHLLMPNGQWTKL